MARSRWVASLVVAFAVSWSFHQVDEVQDRKLERQQNVIKCTIEGVATEQARYNEPVVVAVEPILERCEEQAG